MTFLSYRTRSHRCTCTVQVKIRLPGRNIPSLRFYPFLPSSVWYFPILVVPFSHLKVRYRLFLGRYGIVSLIHSSHWSLYTFFFRLGLPFQDDSRFLEDWRAWRIPWKRSEGGCKGPVVCMGLSDKRSLTCETNKTANGDERAQPIIREQKVSEDIRQNTKTSNLRRLMWRWDSRQRTIKDGDVSLTFKPPLSSLYE